MTHKERTNAILRELAGHVFHPNYRSLFDQGADALRRYAGEKRDVELGHPISTLKDWEKISEWQRSVWRRNFRAVMKKFEDEGGW